MLGKHLSRPFLLTYPLWFVVLLQAGMRSIWTHGGCVSSRFGLEFFCHSAKKGGWTSPFLLRCLKLRKNLHLSPKTVSQLPWIIHRLPCQPFPSELLSTEETVPLKMVGNLFCGSSSLAEAQFLERDISLKFLRQYFCCCCFSGFFVSPTNKIPSASTVFGKRQKSQREISISDNLSK